VNKDIHFQAFPLHYDIYGTLTVSQIQNLKPYISEDIWKNYWCW